MIQQLIISLPMIVCGILSVELAVSIWLKYDPAKTCLQAWSLTATALYATHYIFYSHASEPVMRIADGVYTMTNLIVYPLYLVYIYELTDSRPLQLRRRAVAILYHVSITFGVVAWYFYGTPTQELVHIFCRILFAVSVVSTVILGMRRIRTYHELLDTLYADTEERQLKGISIILYILLVMSLSSMVMNVLGRYYFVGSKWLVVPSLLFSCLIFAIGQVGLRQKYSIRDVEADEAKGETDNVEVDDDVQLQADDNVAEASLLILKLKTLVEDERLFTQQNLKLDDLARRLGTNRTYLLRAMKQELQLSFSEYINQQRIAYALKLMKAHPDLTREDIAEQVGYASTSSFYRNIKEFGV